MNSQESLGHRESPQLPTDRYAAFWAHRGSDLPKVPESQWPGSCSFHSRALYSERFRRRGMDGVHVNRLRVKKAPEKEVRDRSLQPGPLAHLHLGCPARRAFSELSPAWMASGHGGRGGGTGVRLSTNWT